MTVVLPVTRAHRDTIHTLLCDLDAWRRRIVWRRGIQSGTHDFDRRDFDDVGPTRVDRRARGNGSALFPDVAASVAGAAEIASRMDSSSVLPGCRGALRGSRTSLSAGGVRGVPTVLWTAAHRVHLRHRRSRNSTGRMPGDRTGDAGGARPSRPEAARDRAAGTRQAIRAGVAPGHSRGGAKEAEGAAAAAGERGGRDQRRDRSGDGAGFQGRDPVLESGDAGAAGGAWHGYAGSYEKHTRGNDSTSRAGALRGARHRARRPRWDFREPRCAVGWDRARAEPKRGDRSRRK